MPDPAAVASAGSRRVHRVFGRLASPSRYGFAIAAPDALVGAAAAYAEVWSARVDGSSPGDAADEWLDEAEQARAASFHFERDRQRFVQRRAFLRRVLAGYVGVKPSSIRYRHGRGQRPELDPPCGVSFSTSHADGLAVIAIALDRVVGIDIEHVRKIPEDLEMARSLFTQREQDHLGSLESDEQSAAFLRLWTRKEAYTKALGAGLSLPLDTFDVLGDVVMQAVGGPADGAQFALADLDMFPSHVGSIAVSAT